MLQEIELGKITLIRYKMQGIEKKIKDHCNSNSLHETVTAKWEKKIALNKPNEGHHLALRFILPVSVHIIYYLNS